MDHALPRILVIASAQAGIGSFLDRLAASGEGLPAMCVDTHGPQEPITPWVRQALLEHRPYRLAIVDLDDAPERQQSLLEDLRSQDSYLPILCVVPSAMSQVVDPWVIQLRRPLEWLELRQWVATLLESGVLREERGKLSELTEQLRRQLVAVCEKADAAEQAKNEFMANVSHEIRTPLNAILGFSELLMREPLEQGQLEKLGYVCDGGRELLRVIESLLDFSKLSAGSIKLKATTFQVERLLSDITHRWQSAARTKGLNLTFHADTSAPRSLHGDAGRLRQVISNLVENAVKFTEQGSVHLEVVTDEENADGALLRFTVSDTGPGIAPDRQAIVFDSFRQGDGSATRRFGGVGLGLAICRQLVTLMGGQIGLRSALNEGSSFWFTVPMLKQAESGEAEVLDEAGPVWRLGNPAVSEPHVGVQRAESEPDAGFGRPLVLVAASDRLTRTMLEVILTRSGCVVQLTGTQEEARRLFRDHRYNLAFVEGEWLQDQSFAHPHRVSIVGLLQADQPPSEEDAADEWLARPIVYELLYTLLQRRLSESAEEPETPAEPSGAMRLDAWMEGLGAALDRWDFQDLENRAQAVRTLAIESGWSAVADHAMRLQLAARGAEPARTARAVATLRQAVGKRELTASCAQTGT